jgi:integrase
VRSWRTWRSWVSWYRRRRRRPSVTSPSTGDTLLAFLASPRGQSVCMPGLLPNFCFLDHDPRPQRLCKLRGADIEAFIAKTSKRVGRGRMGQITAALRTFLRFLATTGDVPSGLDAEVDSPRIYRGERLPRAVPWETVGAFLRSIDRSTPKRATGQTAREPAFTRIIRCRQRGPVVPLARAAYSSPAMRPDHCPSSDPASSVTGTPVTAFPLGDSKVATSPSRWRNQVSTSSFSGRESCP